jgi:hypothetical protein
VPVNSGANPEAPLGGQITQFSAVPEPEEFPAPVVAAPPEEVVVPREVVPADPLGAVELELVVVVAVVGLPVVVNDGAMGSATAPPEVGKPLRVAALPTFPVVGVATWARAGLAAASSRAIANSDARVISKQRAIA